MLSFLERLKVPRCLLLWVVLYSLPGSLLLLGCDTRGTDPGTHDSTALPEPTPVAVTTASPQPEPALIAEAAPEPITSEPASDSEEAPLLLSESLLARVARGMTPGEVTALLGKDGVAVGGDGSTVQVLRWTDSAGNSFSARFDDGKLRTGGKLRRPVEHVTERPAAVVAAREIDGKSAAEIAPGVFVPLKRAVASANSQPMGVQPPEADAAPEVGVGEGIRWVVPSSGRDQAVVVPQGVGPTVVVGGALRRAREQAGDSASGEESSYRPHARLPEFTRTLPKGRFEVRLVNETETKLTVGLRQDKLGDDVHIGVKEQASLFVDRGTYELSFLCEDEPDACYDAPPLTIDGFHAPDVSVHLSREEVIVRLIDYSLPE